MSSAGPRYLKERLDDPPFGPPPTDEERAAADRARADRIAARERENVEYLARVLGTDAGPVHYDEELLEGLFENAAERGNSFDPAEMTGKEMWRSAMTIGFEFGIRYERSRSDA